MMWFGADLDTPNLTAVRVKLIYQATAMKMRRALTFCRGIDAPNS
jgi:hypothetical protein